MKDQKTRKKLVLKKESIVILNKEDLGYLKGGTGTASCITWGIETCDPHVATCARPTRCIPC